MEGKERTVDGQAFSWRKFLEWPLAHSLYSTAFVTAWFHQFAHSQLLDTWLQLIRSYSPEFLYALLGACRRSCQACFKMCSGTILTHQMMFLCLCVLRQDNVMSDMCSLLIRHPSANIHLRKVDGFPTICCSWPELGQEFQAKNLSWLCSRNEKNTSYAVSLAASLSYITPWTWKDWQVEMLLI